MINAVIERCAGIDIGKKFLVACTMVGSADAEPEVEQRTYGTTTGDLERLRQWLLEQGCTHVAMESTGSYWKPVFNVLEGSLTVLLANPEQVKARKGHKTDHKDSWWLAHLLRHAMIRPSFVPPRAVRELRDLTRRRKQVLHDAASERNRVQKILEDANIKLGNVLTDLFGVSDARRSVGREGVSRADCSICEGPGQAEDTGAHRRRRGSPDERPSPPPDSIQPRAHGIS